MNNSDGVQQAAEILRLVIPRLSRLKWPVNPINYALWYEYYAADNALLNSKLEELEKGVEQWSPEVSEELFRTHVLGEGAGRLDNISQDVRSLLSQVLTLVSDADGDFEEFNSSLQEADAVLSSEEGVIELGQMVSRLLHQTQAMQLSNQIFQQQLEDSTREVERLRRDLDQIKQEAFIDPLTGLGNRKVLEKEFAEAICAADAGESACLIMIDVDHFKRLNDRFGHLVGDKVLKFIGNSLTKAVKGRDTVVRYGGEEFCVILRDIAPQGALSVAEGIRRSIEESKLTRSETGESLGPVTISLGVTCLRKNETECEVIERADRALYASKHQGRNRVTASPGML